MIPATFLTWFIPFVFVGVNAAREGSAGPWALVIVLSGGVVGWFAVQIAGRSWNDWTAAVEDASDERQDVMPNPDPDVAKRGCEFVSGLRDYWGAYHHQKEQTAFAVATIFLGAATAVVITPKPLTGDSGFQAIALATAVLAIWFVQWQLDYRLLAADLVAACLNLQTKWLGTAPTADDIKAEPFMYRGKRKAYDLPLALVNELNAVRAHRRWNDGTKIPAYLTLVLMILWTAVAAFRVLSH